MAARPPRPGDRLVVQRVHLDQLFGALERRDYRLVGPTVRDGAIVLDELACADELPEGWTDRQDGGHYRLEERSDRSLFGHVVGPHSWKRFLFPPVQPLWRARRNGRGFEVEPDDARPPHHAFIGVRACEIQAIAVQDRVFLEGAFVDPGYAARRSRVFIVAVNCVEAGGTCFCTSMGSGPRVTCGFDLALTELVGAGRHELVLEIGSDVGATVAAELDGEPAPGELVAEVERRVAAAAASMGRALDTTEIRELLYRNHEHPRWLEVAGRCLSCANCTMVCPTCFCSTVEDVTDLTGERAERVRRWDSCFTGDFSYIVGGNLRQSTQSRYRQWMMHKLATWIDQFGTSGCVGCGRCITWCPVGIDITRELGAFRDEETSRSRQRIGSQIAQESHAPHAPHVSTAPRGSRVPGAPLAPGEETP